MSQQRIGDGLERTLTRGESEKTGENGACGDTVLCSDLKERLSEPALARIECVDQGDLFFIQKALAARANAEAQIEFVSACISQKYCLGQGDTFNEAGVITRATGDPGE